MVFLLKQNINITDLEDIHSDCLIVYGDAQVRCPSVLLSIVSEMLSEILPQPRDDKEDTVIILPDVDVEVLRLVVELLCRGEVKYRAISDQRDDIAQLLTRLGAKTLTLQDIPCETDDLSADVEDSQPDFRVGPMYEDDVDMLGNDEGKESSASHEVISAIYNDSEDSTDGEKVEYQESNALQMFFNSSPLVSFQVPRNEHSICTKTCEVKCQSVFKTWSQCKKMILNSLFAADKTIDVKKKLLTHLGSQAAIGLSTDSFIVNSHSFCFHFLSYVTGISVFILKSVIGDFSRGKKIYEHANTGIAKVKPATSVFVAWLNEFAECYGQDSPDENLTVLSYWLNKKVLYDMYLDETLGPHLSQSSFYENFKTFFGPNRQDKCLRQIRIREGFNKRTTLKVMEFSCSTGKQRS